MKPFVKRAVDVGLSLLGLVFGAPLIALIALAIRLDSPGRVIFSQERLGQHGRPFRIHKFRKFPDAWGSRGPMVTVANDARMTRLGRFLERSKFDEIPQLWNILKGEMSFVGPRPHTLRSRDWYAGELAGVLDFVPGIFGPSQVAFRNESQLYPPDRDPEEFYRTELFPRKARADLAYFSQATIGSDLGWLLRGVWHSIAGAVDWRAHARRRGCAMAVDLLAIEFAWIGANLVRFEGVPAASALHSALIGMWLMPLVVLPVMLLCGSYRGAIRHFALGDAIRLAAGSLIGWSMALLVMLAFFERSNGFYLIPFACVLSLLTMGGMRIAHRENSQRHAAAGRRDDHVRIAVYGAGRRGVALATLLKRGFPHVRLIGFLDDNDADMRGRSVAGHPVLGSERDLETLHAVHRIDQIWVTFEPEIHRYRRLQTWCAANQIRLVILPLAEPFQSLDRTAAWRPEAQSA
jgi:lipopolysaccharide/colanic/teichoic acid biosynthesis glycosyltransferase